ncbi:MAG: hypothetical protein JNL32_10375 [Candidatus Kapabacteria bacterium]|nr:hypothetical protein [Candidatus Kapabacteria bacterium]
MSFLYLIAIATVVFFLTITLVVIAQEISIILSVVIFAAALYGAYKLAGNRLTRL